jgi:beta-glucosidase-like glycosyl hydrolase
MEFYQFLVPRLDGDSVEGEFGRLLELVKKGVSGFIVFGGELEPLRECIRRLQEEAPLPLLIAADLEQGLGQQVRGGTLFPPAMALKEASKINGMPDPSALRPAFAQMADEAAYAGINTILAPVLDVNTNPLNPIICTRAFCETPEAVTSLGIEMIRTIQSRGVMACGKHFPGHGDTEADSHETLPVINKSIEELESLELIPFRAAVRAGVGLMMTGHLSVPAIDPTGTPMSLSARGMRFLRDNTGFRGIVATDAMNMGALVSYVEHGPARMALEAGLDLLLHPADPDSAARELEGSGVRPPWERLSGFRKRLLPAPSESRPSFDPSLALELTEQGITLEGSLRPLGNPFLLLISDDREEKGRELARALGWRHAYLTAGAALTPGTIPPGCDLVVAAFSTIKAWKEDTTAWIRENIKRLSGTARVFISFGSPYILDDVGDGPARLYAYWGSPEAQRAAANRLLNP